MNIILIGYRGCGKSTVAQLLSKELNLRPYSLDVEIEKNEGKTIPEIVAQHDWPYFREIETQILKKFIHKKGIIDCGGGIIEKEENRNLLNKQLMVFFLKASVEEVQKRLADKTDRPSLTGAKDFLSEIKEVYERRMPLYETSAKYIIDANQNSDMIAKAILNILEITHA